MPSPRRKAVILLLKGAMFFGLGSCTPPSSPPAFACYTYMIDIHPGDGGAASLEEVERALLAAGASCWEQDEGTRLGCSLPDDVDSQSESACEQFVAAALDSDDGGFAPTARVECENTCES